ncbi:Ran GAP Rna1 [Sorochytrium milnesiophthora]
MTSTQAAPQSSDTVFSIVGKCIKFNTAEDVQPYVEQLQKMPNLKEIHLSGNTFSSEASKALSAALKDKHQLEVCQFSDMFTGRLKNDIPHSLSALTEVLLDKPVHTLDLSDNAFGPTGAEPLRPYLSHTRSLQVLRLYNNGLGPQGGTIIAQSLIANHEERVREGVAPGQQPPAGKTAAAPLRVFIAGRNRLENGSMGPLAEAFRTLGTLEHIQIPGNGIRSEGVSTLLKQLRHCHQLRVLDLQENTFTRAGARALAKAIPHWPHLHTLNLGDCLMSARGAKDLFAAMLAPASSSTSSTPVPVGARLERLHLSFNDIKADGAALVCDWLRAHGKNVTLLELNGNCFDGEGEVVQRIRAVLAEHGHPDALDELDEMDDEVDDDDEEEEDDDEGDDALAADDSEDEEQAETRKGIEKLSVE